MHNMKNVHLYKNNLIIKHLKITYSLIVEISILYKRLRSRD